MSRAFIKDPLVLFLLAGAFLFVFASVWQPDQRDAVIEVTDAEINRLTDQWQAQMGRPPSPTELDNLIDQFVAEEVYYREALRLNLDTNDVIIRRRLVQKLTFLTEDIATAVPPTEEALRAYFTDKAERYRLPIRISFRHRYFSSDRRENARADAVAALADDSHKGDPFMLQRSYAERSPRQIADLFGKKFAQPLLDLPIGTWSGPVESAYGWHVVLLQTRLASELPSFESIQSKVISDWQRDQRQAANEAYYRALLEGYQVARP